MFIFIFLIQDRILLYSNLSIYVRETPSWRFKPRLLPPTPVAELEFELRGGKTCIRYMHFMHIYLMYLKRKKNRNNKHVK